jgi:solute carrier family 35 protein F1/2
MGHSVIQDAEIAPLIQAQNYRINEEVRCRDDNVWRDLERRRETSTSSYRRNKWVALLFGQFIALVATSQNAASFTLEYGMGKFFPMFLMFNTYVILSLHVLCNRPSSDEEAPHRIPFTSIRLRTPWWYYLCLSILDVAPNYLTLLSLKHTSLTSATLLGSLTVPSTMLVCGFLLAKVYKPQHYFGVILCMTGGLLTIWTDLDHRNDPSSTSQSHPHSYYGDMLAVVAALIYGVGDAAGEFWSKHVDRKEYLGMIGLFGSIFCLVIVPIWERDAVYELFEDSSTILPALGVMLLYIPLLVTYYVSATLFLVSSDATLLNLSLQSSNLWAILFSVVAFRESPPLLFYVAVVFVVAGVFVYELLGNSCPHRTSKISPPAVSPSRKGNDMTYQSIETFNL